jgi:hypothetical protein
MVLHRFIPRLVLFSCLVLAGTACTQTVSEQAGSPTVSSSPQARTPTPLTLQTLLQRSLHLPVVAANASCPTSPEKKVQPGFGIAQGNGPVYATIGTDVITSPAVFDYADAQHFGDGGADNQGWGGQKVLWFVNPGYQGLVLVRGHQVDGPHEMRFDGGLSGRPLAQQLVLDTTLGGTPWPNFPSYTRLQAPGCYAYQIDGANFSYVIVFLAIVQN